MYLIPKSIFTISHAILEQKHHPKTNFQANQHKNPNPPQKFRFHEFFTDPFPSTLINLQGARLSFPDSCSEAVAKKAAQLWKVEPSSKAQLGHVELSHSGM